MRFLVLAIVLSAGAAAPAQDVAGIDPRIPGVTVSDALDALKEDPGVALSTAPNGWVKGIERGGRVRWLFAPVGHPARPAVIRQGIVPGGGIELSVKCQGAPRECQRLIDEFTIENERMKLRKLERFE